MKTDWSKWSLTSDSTAITADNYATTTASTAIYMEEKKARGVSFDALEKVLRKMGIFLTEIHQDSYNDYAEITCKVNPIDWYISLDGKNTPSKKKDDRPHPKKVHFPVRQLRYFGQTELRQLLSARAKTYGATKSA